MTNSIYVKPNPQLRQLFEEASDLRHVLCAPLDYAKTHHTVLFCNGQGDVLKRPFAVENSLPGLGQLLAQLQSTCRRYHIQNRHVLFGGEDSPSWAENFMTGLRARGFVVVHINAWQAKNHRQNFLASSDTLDLGGIAHCLLKCCGQSGPPVSDDYRRLRDLVRQRQVFVGSATALTNQVHPYVDRLFPQFLDLKKSGIPPFSAACWWLLEDRFSAPQIARRRPQGLIDHLRELGLENAPTIVAQLQNWAGQALPPDPKRVAGWQQILQVQVAQWQSLHQAILQLDGQIGPLLAQLPGAVLTSVAGIGVTLAAGLTSEMGPPEALPSQDRLCAYAGVVPALKQTGGPNKAPVVFGPRPHCNHHLKNYVLQVAQKIGQLGPADLQERYRQVEARGGAVDFVMAKEILGLSKSLMQRQTIYLPAALYAPDSSAQDRAAYSLGLWPKLLAKWRGKAPAAVVFAPKTPLGQWRLMIQQLHKISLPLPKTSTEAQRAARPSTPGASARLK